eukprot:g8270.t1
MSEAEKVKQLVALGLPEQQAIASAKALANGTTPSKEPCTCKAVMTIKEGADINALTAAVKAYAAAGKTSVGTLHAAYGMTDKEVTTFEVYDSPAAMDAHIGNCFEHFVKMVPHCEMAEIGACVHESEIEFWTNSLSAWAPKKFSVTANI